MVGHVEPGPGAARHARASPRFGLLRDWAGIRAPLEGDAAYVAMELQILEDGSPVYWGLQPYQYHGSIYGVVPARRGVLRPVGEWNREEVTVKGIRTR